MVYIQNAIVGAIDTELNGHAENNMYVFRKTESRSVKASKIRGKRLWDYYPSNGWPTKEEMSDAIKCTNAPIPKPMQIKTWRPISMSAKPLSVVSYAENCRL